MPTGKILSLNADKGFGFIQPAAGGPDLFFHCSAVDTEFSSLQVEQEVQYTPDPSASKPRALEVLTGGPPRKTQQNSSSSAKRTSSNRRPERPQRNYSFGYITKLPRKNPIGFISAISGGYEYYFEPKDVYGKSFATLAVGDYVSFLPQDNPDDPKQPFAKSVKVVPRPINRQENRLARHPQARRKKPTWRRSQEG